MQAQDQVGESAELSPSSRHAVMQTVAGLEFDHLAAHANRVTVPQDSIGTQEVIARRSEEQIAPAVVARDDATHGGACVGIANWMPQEAGRLHLSMKIAGCNAGGGSHAKIGVIDIDHIVNAGHIQAPECAGPAFGESGATPDRQQTNSIGASIQDHTYQISSVFGRDFFQLISQRAGQGQTPDVVQVDIYRVSDGFVPRLEPVPPVDSLVLTDI